MKRNLKSKLTGYDFWEDAPFLTDCLSKKFVTDELYFMDYAMFIDLLFNKFPYGETVRYAKFEEGVKVK